MKIVDAGSRNIGFYAAMAASYTAALPMINGALMQLFLADKGLSTVQIGTFATVVQLSTLLGTMVFSKTADKSENPKRFTGLVLLGQMVLSLCYLVIAKTQLPANSVLILTSGLAAVITGLAALKGILDYKLPYQIVPLDKYGNMIFFNSAINGVVGIGLSFCFSRIIAVKLGGEPYIWCMVLASALLLVSCISCLSMKPIEGSVGDVPVTEIQSNHFAHTSARRDIWHHRFHGTDHAEFGIYRCGCLQTADHYRVRVLIGSRNPSFPKPQDQNAQHRHSGKYFAPVSIIPAP